MKNIVRSLRATAGYLIPAILMLVGIASCASSPSKVTPTPDIAQQSRDTLLALTAAGRTTCVVTSGEKQFCWGGSKDSSGKIFHLSGFNGQPPSLQSLSIASWTALRRFCGISTDHTLLCTRGIVTNIPDSSRQSQPSVCIEAPCLLPVVNKYVNRVGAILSIAVGDHHVCIATFDGIAYCTGDNRHGQLGDGTQAKDLQGRGAPRVDTLVRVAGDHRFIQLSANNSYTCGVTAPEGAIYCWGYGHSGETGDSAAMPGYSRGYPAQPSLKPNYVLAESLAGDFVAPRSIQFASVHTGRDLACGVTISGNVYCWGSNYRCALGRCRSADSPLAHQIPLPGYVVEVAAGNKFACARTRDRRIFCWGDNNFGQLGSAATRNADEQGMPPDYSDTVGKPQVYNQAYNDVCFLGGRCSPAPVEVAPQTPWSALAVGESHACALSEADGGVYCWGGGDSTSFGANPKLTVCENRSVAWADNRCQRTPYRVAGLPELTAKSEVFSAQSRWEYTRSAMLDVVDMPSVIVSQESMQIRVPLRDMLALSNQIVTRELQYGSAPYLKFMLKGLAPYYFLNVSQAAEHREQKPLTSVSDLISRSTASFCWQTSSFGSSCADSLMALQLQQDTIVLTLRDREKIIDMFGLKPKAVLWDQDFLRLPPRVFGFDSIPITYVAPEIPYVDSAIRARATIAQRELQAKSTSVSRRIEGVPYTDTLWLVVGDSVMLHVLDMIFKGCVGSSSRYPVFDTGWSLTKKDIVGMRIDSAPKRDYAMQRIVYLGATSIGRTTLRVDGLSSVWDTLPRIADPPLKQTLTAEIIVIPPVSRVELSVPKTEAFVDEPLLARVRLYDKRGKVIVGAPIDVRTFQGDQTAIVHASDTTRVAFRKTGSSMIIATFKDHADTVHVRVRNRASEASR